ncbi:MAG: zinc-binding dehydrogenase [Xanthobacteraceae bacterium]
MQMLAVVNTPNGKVPVELRQVPEPALKPHEALVAVQAFSLNRGELRSFKNAEEGWIPGQDISGTVLRQAADGSGPSAGSRIVALLDEFGWAERTAVPTQRIAVLPDTVSFAAAAALPIAGLTALRTLRHGAPLLGKRVLITGAAGGVGHLAVQLAARSGAHVTAIAGRPERAAGLRELGAAEVVLGIEQAQGRFGLILESAGGSSLAAALHAVDANGVVVVFGNSSGDTTSISFADFRDGQNARLQSFFSFTSGPEEAFAPDLALLVALVVDKSLTPHTGPERNWRDIARVAEELRDRRIGGKAVFRVEA